MTVEPNKLRVNKKYEQLLTGKINTRYLLLTGGRGSGKSFASSLFCALKLLEPKYRILYTRYTLTSAHISIIPEFLQKIELLGQSSNFDSTLTTVKNKKNASEILFKGIKSGSGSQTASLKSLQGINVWILDEAEELDDEKTFNTIDLSIRDTRQKNLIIIAMNPSYKSHWMYQRFFKGLPDEFTGVKDNVTYIHSSYLDNKENLADDYLQLAENLKNTNPLEYNRTWMGHWSEQVEGALFTWLIIDKNRVDKDQRLPDFERVIVAIDPAVTANIGKSDETGIVTVAKGVDGHYYVLSDVSCVGTPLEWATRAIAEYHKRKADRIVAEVNQGGLMVENTLKNVDSSVSYKEVRATRGKILRAEPCAALYEQNLVHHIGHFTNLETEMVSYSGKTSDASPGRLDALVWCLTELMGQQAFEIATLTDGKKKNSWVDVY